MEPGTIRDIEEKVAKVKRDAADPRTVTHYSAAAGGVMGIVCALILCAMAAPDGNPFLLMAGLPIAGWAVGYGAAKSVFFLREKAEGVRERLAPRRKARADSEDYAVRRASDGPPPGRYSV